jgi:leucine efflux protein
VRPTWPGSDCKLLLAKTGAAAAPIRIEPRHHARQAFLITLLNPKAIVFYMAFFPLFIDPATTRAPPPSSPWPPPLR